MKITRIIQEINERVAELFRQETILLDDAIKTDPDIRAIRDGIVRERSILINMRTVYEKACQK